MFGRGFRRYLEKREMEEGRKQIRANTQAVLSMLDRFNQTVCSQSKVRES